MGNETSLKTSQGGGGGLQPPQPSSWIRLCNHSIFLSKLDLYGIKGNADALICSYLHNCTQKCSVNRSLSESHSLTLHAAFPNGLYLGLCYFFYILMICQIVCLILNQECLLTTLI